MARVLGGRCGCGPPDGLEPLDRYRPFGGSRDRFAPALLPQGSCWELELPPPLERGVIRGRGPAAHCVPDSVDRVLLPEAGRERCGPRPGGGPRPRTRTGPWCRSLHLEAPAVAARGGIGDPRPRRR